MFDKPRFRRGIIHNKLNYILCRCALETQKGIWRAVLLNLDCTFSKEVKQEAGLANQSP